jgi:anthranilate synthase component 2
MIVIIDNYDSFTYNLYQAIANHETEVNVIRNDQITVDQLIALQPRALVISPGPGRPEQAGISIAAIQGLAAKIPILGVCLGHQSIGMAFGGQVCLAAEPIHGKDVLITHHGKDLYENLPSPMRVGRYHSLIVSPENFPACLMVEAIGPNGLIMGIRHRQFPCFGVQFHPESILTPQGNQLINNFLNLIPINVA